jgi:uncharacterized protein
MLQQLGELLAQLAPQAVLLGGDLVDFPGGRAPLAEWLRQLPYPVYAVPGNHDRWSGLSALKRALPSQVHWLEEQEVTLECGLRLCGRPAQGGSPQSLLVGHEPTHVRAAARARFPAMLAGHLHGCQWIWATWRGLDFPGACFFRYHGPYFEVQGTRLWVSRGISDTLPLRINCPRDVLMLEVS